MERNLILIRGIPGSGKSTLAKIIAPHSNVAADDYFDHFHGGEFIPSGIKSAHNWCQSCCQQMMALACPVIAIHNTFTQEWEMERYYKLAEEYGYRVHTIIAENRHGSKSVHGVPEDVLQKMHSRFNIKL